jgi:hypothetical protein
MITDAQLAQYERNGAVVIDGPFINSPEMLADLEAAWDRLNEANPAGGVQRPAARPAYEEQAYMDCIGHPFFEAVAQKVLRADEVGLFWGVGAPHARPPSAPPFRPWREQWAAGCHIDIQVARR